MIYGLATALCWGLADLGAAVVSRRFGSFRTLVAAQAGSMIPLTLLLLFGLTPPTGPLGWNAVSVIAAGVFATLAFYSLYRGLELGPVAIVSPVTAAYSAITLLLAVVLLNEHLTSLAAVGAGLTIAGVVGATAAPRAVHRGDPEHDPGRAGIAYGFLAMATFGVATFLIGSAARTLDWFVPTYLSRIATLATLAVVVVVIRIRPRRTPRAPSQPMGWKGFLAATAIGVADAAGLMFFSLAGHEGMVAIAAATSAVFPLVPVAGGVLLFGERPTALQLSGVGIVITGLVLLGLGG